MVRQHRPGYLVEFGQADPDVCVLADFLERGSNDAAGRAHCLDLGRCLELYHPNMVAAARRRANWRPRAGYPAVPELPGFQTYGVVLATGVNPSRFRIGRLICEASTCRYL